MNKPKLTNRISLSFVLTCSVVAIAFITLATALVFFVNMYKDYVEKNSITSSEQAVVMVSNTVNNYTQDIESMMGMIADRLAADDGDLDDFMNHFLYIRDDLVAVTAYDMNGNMLDCWTDGLELKSNPVRNLSYSAVREDGEISISNPHVESLFVNYYPWVVSISQLMQDSNGADVQVFMDIRFSYISNYVDEVGIGQHGYCFIMDTDGNIVYHPQQQLLYSGLKDETVDELKHLGDTVYRQNNVIYTIKTLESSDWRIVGVSFVDEMITSKVENLVHICVVLLALVLVTALLVGLMFSRLFSKPATRLAAAMRDFEKNAENFRFEAVSGTSEIYSLSHSFGHMVVKIQQLMERVRQEEITLRKTELKALQAQINPHFLYNTLDSIAWMCEEERTSEAVEMVNALAKLFRISISKGEEMIPLERELEHAESYLKIQNFRYKNQFEYHFDVDESILGCMCNKITLQPIIENAINHGLTHMVDMGRIDIAIKQEDNGILMMVEDNGVGMTEEMCERILHNESGGKTGIGIKNVNDRIQIYFGKSYGISIASEPDCYTRVEIRIPKLRQEEYEKK